MQWWDECVDIPRLASLLAAGCHAVQWVNTVAIQPAYPRGTADSPWDTALVLSFEVLPPLAAVFEGACAPPFIVHRCTRGLACIGSSSGPFARVCLERAGALAKTLRQCNAVLHVVEG